ncbi:hypothetical protein, partial [Nocardia carnea]|uniref:hypothetical protein n=1 Tax=Nocardia carnea TaxID=37328 RepID=UPI003D7B137D
APSAQRALKSAVVAEQLRRITGIEREPEVEPIPGPPKRRPGRRVSGKGTAGGVAATAAAVRAHR